MCDNGISGAYDWKSGHTMWMSPLRSSPIVIKHKIMGLVVAHMPNIEEDPSSLRSPLWVMLHFPNLWDLFFFIDYCTISITSAHVHESWVHRTVCSLHCPDGHLIILCNNQSFCLGHYCIVCHGLYTDLDCTVRPRLSHQVSTGT